jgi:MinD superfamily P-loop ATPase
MHKPEIDQEKCDGCGLCVSICLQHGLILVDGVVTLVEEVECDWCTQCEAVCATGAISCPFEIIFG